MIDEKTYLANYEDLEIRYSEYSQEKSFLNISTGKYNIENIKVNKSDSSFIKELTDLDKIVKSCIEINAADPVVNHMACIAVIKEKFHIDIT